MSFSAQADVWGYVDSKGVAHFATEKQDERFELFFRGGESFDTARDVPLANTSAIAAPAPMPRKLQAFFEISPGYKSVRLHLQDAARSHGLDYELLKALIVTESGFDARAVSPKGAVGLMQVMPATAERWGLRGDARAPVARQLTDPRTNIRVGVRYLRHLINLFPGRLDLALAAYNAGEGAVQRAGNRIPDYRETQHYVKTVLQIYEHLKPAASLQASAQPPLRGRMDTQPPLRVRMEFPGAVTTQVMGGAAGRGNMPASVTAWPATLDNNTD